MAVIKANHLMAFVMIITCRCTMNAIPDAVNVGSNIPANRSKALQHIMEIRNEIPVINNTEGNRKVMQIHELGSNSYQSHATESNKTTNAENITVSGKLENDYSMGSDIALNIQLEPPDNSGIARILNANMNSNDTAKNIKSRTILSEILLSNNNANFNTHVNNVTGFNFKNSSTQYLSNTNNVSATTNSIITNETQLETSLNLIENPNTFINSINDNFQSINNSSLQEHNISICNETKTVNSTKIFNTALNIIENRTNTFLEGNFSNVMYTISPSTSTNQAERENEAAIMDEALSEIENSSLVNHTEKSIDLKLVANNFELNMSHTNEDLNISSTINPDNLQPMLIKSTMLIKSKLQTIKIKPAMIKRSRSSSDQSETANALTEMDSVTTSLQIGTTSVSRAREDTNLERDRNGEYADNLHDRKVKLKTTPSPPQDAVLLFSSTEQSAASQVESTLLPSGEPPLDPPDFERPTIISKLPEAITKSSDKFQPQHQCPNCNANISDGITTDATDGDKVKHQRKMVTITMSSTNLFDVTTSTAGWKLPQDLSYNVNVEDNAVTDASPTETESAGFNSSVKVSEFPWPVKKEAVVEGDIVLGGLMMVHEREDSVTCGPVMPQGGIQALEAMLYTLDRLNDGPNQILPNITLGAHILDDCDKDTYGLEMAVDFIKGSISNIDGAEYSCNKTQVRKVISGVVGAASSVTSIQVANLLRLFKIPQVSFFSTSPELSNKQRFEYFTRTIPSDHYQVKAMVDIVKRMGWSYVSIIYEESNYGIKAFEELEDLLAEYNICIAVKEKLVKDSGVADESAYDNIVQKLLTKPRARGAIIFGSDQEVAGVMRAVRRNNATGSFSWIGSDGWSARSLVSDGNEAEVEGTLSVQPQANPVLGFEEYFLSLNVENNKRNPWFIEFWEHHFQCRYPNSSRTPYNQKYTRMCTGKEELTKQNTVFEDQLQFVSDAVMAFGYAIRDMHQDLCNGKPGLCDTMKPTKGTELLKYLRKVNFKGLSGDRFHFDGNGDGPARYNIIHFKQLTPGKYRWIRVGEYVEGELRLNMSEIQFKLEHPKPPESVCSLPCDLGQAKKYVEGESCCWHCFNCTQYQIRHPIDPTQCIGCPLGTVPDPQHVHCMDIPEEYLQPDSGWAIGAMALSSSGIFITLFVCGVFVRHNDTPVVRASGRELSYVLLAGIFMCYCVTYALVLRPSDIVCGIQRFGAGFCFTVVYAALLTKTNRISRIFNAGKRSAKRPSFISPRSQLIICTGLVAVQVLINGIWMIISPARAIYHYPTREDNLLVCSSYIDASYMIAFSYPILLIVVCTVYAVLTRKIPEAFNESKHIGFTMYTTCVIWLAFVPLYFGTANHVALRITSMSVTISLSASVTVVCLFSPKLYIILVRPERNVRQSMMPMRYSAINKSTTATTNSGAGSMMAAVMVTAATCNQKNQIQKHVPPIEITEREENDSNNKVKPPMRETGTQTQLSPNHINHTDDNMQKINNNCNGPIALVQCVPPKEHPL